ncbi:MAG: DNA mismatch repair protein MutS [Planctomycetota bacterium]|nr:DNA mismatch repair protein MutS [Planctomycetota bacterium]
MSTEKLQQLDTPAMRQYRQFKDKYPDYILFFRMGDFYEMFYEDAKIASRVLGLALTSRSKGPSAVPLAGIPYHALDSYLSKLVRAGRRVAICEQVEDPKQAKGVVKRDVVRLVTPGTLTEENLLDQREGNYLAAVFDPNDGGQNPRSAVRGLGRTSKNQASHQVGIAWVEVSSGAFETMLAPADHVMDELVRIRPAEVIVPESSAMDEKGFRDSLRQYVGSTVTACPPWAFEAHSAEELLKEHFGTRTLAGFGFDEYDPSVSAAGAVIDYLRQTQKTALAHIGSLRRFDRIDRVIMDGNSIRCLEILRTLRTHRRAGTLVETIDATVTGMGARLLERWLTWPLRSYSDIVARQDAVEELASDGPRLARLRGVLDGMSQIDRIASNIALVRIRPRELLGLGGTLARLPEVCELLIDCKADLVAALPGKFTGLDAPADLIERAINPDCPPTLRDGGVIAEGFDEELDRLRRIGTDGQNWLADYQARQTERTGIANLKVGYNRVFGYYLEVSHANADKVPPDFVRKQTLKNAERYITDELKRFESEALTAEERARTLEARLFEQVRVELSGYVAQFQAAASAIATLDVLSSFAHLAVERNYRRPTITQDNVLHIVGGKHPVLAEMLRDQFVPNDVRMDAGENRLLIITGPNMSGKSTYIRQTAILVLMAQTGCFIPAEHATIGIVDRIFTRVGAADELTAGLSTFMVEMIETANILNNATGRSLVILDEVGRGTSTYDGLALAWAICEHIALRIKCRTMFATHYHELTELENLLDGSANLNVSVREWADEVVFLHKIVPGGTDRSYGVHVARLAGVPKEVIDRARTILPQLQAHLAEGLDMPELAERAKTAAAQMNLFADPSTRVAREIKAADLNEMTPMEALDLLRKLKGEL